MRTQVGIVGAGPAGLVLSHLLHLHGIESVVLEARDRAYVESRVRAGVLEHATADLLRQAGLGERMDAEGLPHEGISLQFEGERHRIPMTALTGRRITVYGQQEVVRDLIARRLADGGRIVFEAAEVRVDGVEADDPVVTWTAAGRREELRCDVVVGCDGFHGTTRSAVPAGLLRTHQRTYPFAWLGILAEAEPAVDELVYSLHERGFALYSMRSPAVSRLYLQVRPDTDLADWPHERIWAELETRLGGSDGPGPNRGRIVDVGVTPMRSVVTEPLQHRSLFLAGDAVHIVPPTGAKGMNLAVHDVRVLAEGLEAHFHRGDRSHLERYTQTALRRVWRAQHFSWWMTSMLHRMDEGEGSAGDYGHRVQIAQLRNVVESEAYARALSENYVG
ncbi:p-hydroxybenzoate 3-monooxygenase [Kineococcus xinjiangensis]|uniref:p-hydroxybenzoate 3-monooxygenase n=1 Tax=Kineococcus xinjiangensis TaxID=512762 RepID=A0A2S6IUT2_9ACTN|nr:4-hydroxybenzoate 3-monooxygenase [Kineococcus xinjiangensis]PPK97913.1 p-hydroxybenzoate 3-monooxygenase [Kineococcus xinjiangensis]